MIYLKRRPLDQIKVTSPFGFRTHPVTGEINSYHSGVDYEASTGTSIYAVDDGIVVISKVNVGGDECGYGYFVCIQHEGYCSLYAHLEELSLPVGTKVWGGQLIAKSGATGRVTGAHLHFEIRNSNYNPLTFWERDANNKFINSVDPEECITMEERSEEETSEWAKDWRKLLIDLKISDGSRPKELITREETWTLLGRIYTQLIVESRTK